MNISKYVSRKFSGVDVNLEISLLEYGLIWKEYKRAVPKKGITRGEVLFIVGTGWDDAEQTYTGTDYAYITKAEVLDETWINWTEVANYIGATTKELREQDCGQLVYDLIGYYGAEEVLGVSQ